MPERLHMECQVDKSVEPSSSFASDGNENYNHPDTSQRRGRYSKFFFPPEENRQEMEERSINVARMTASADDDEE